MVGEYLSVTDESQFLTLNPHLFYLGLALV